MSKSNSAEHSDAAPARNRGYLARVVFQTFRKHPFGIAGIVLLAVIAGSCIWLFLPLPKNTVAVVFQLSAQPQGLLSQSTENRVDFASYRQLQMALIKNRKTLNAALDYKQNDVTVRNLGILQAAEPDLLTWLEKHINIDSRSNSEFMRVTIEGNNADELLVLLNGITKAYMEQTSGRDNRARDGRQEDLKKTYESTRAEVKRFHEKIDEIAKALGSKDGTTLAILESFRQDSLRAAVREYASLQDEVVSSKTRLEGAKGTAIRHDLLVTIGLVGSASSGLGGVEWLAPFPRQWDVPAALIEEEIRRDAGMKEREVAVVKARQALVETEGLFTPGTTPPAVLKAREELKSAEEKRDKYRDEIRAELALAIKRKFAQSEELRIASMQSEHEELIGRVNRARSKVEGIKTEISKSNEYKIELETLKSDIAQKEKIAASMADDIERMRIDKIPSRVRVDEDPYVIPGIEGNRRLKYAVLASIGVFLVGMGALIFWEYRGRRVTHSDEVSTELGARLIGTIPPILASANNKLPAMASRALVEAIDTTRTMLIHSAPQGNPLRVLAITSGVSGEGKTTLSGHLAISLARAGFRTLLIDGDMHAPSAHELFGVFNTPGLSELLRGEVSISEAVQSSPVQGLSIIPAGTWTEMTRQVLASTRWSTLKRELESQFEFVVIDTSPLLLVSDTLLLARDVDGVVLSVLLGVSQIARVVETMDRLRAVNATLTGVVVHNVPSNIYGYGYRYGYGYATEFPTAHSAPSSELPMAEAFSGADEEGIAR